MMNLTNHQSDIYKIQSNPKNPYEAKYQFVINILEKEGLRHYNNTKAFIEYSTDM